MGGVRGLGVLEEDKFDTIQGMVAYIDSTSNTGYMVGDIKLAALSDTDDTDVVGTELVTNGTFDTDTGWVKGTGWTISGGTAVATNVVSGVQLQQNITISVAGTYTISVDIVDTASTYSVTCGTLGTGAINTTGVVTMTGYLASGTHSVHVGAWSSGFTGTVDNVSVRLADTDRSVNANGLAVHGTITKSAVATGADLVGYSFGTSSSCLQQPYNADLNYGTGDFCYMGWVKSSSIPNDWTYIFERTNPSGGSRFMLHLRSSDILETYTNLSGTGTSAQSFTDLGSWKSGNWRHIALVRTGGRMYAYGDGVQSSQHFANTVNYAGIGDEVLTLGSRFSHDDQFAGEMALWRTSATAPSASQIKTIYNAEKVLFQENAQATLYGTSDAVTALAHDDSTNLLHVGTSSGRSVFQGLRRVDNTTTAVGAAISAANGLIAED